MISPANPKLGLRMTTLHEEQMPLVRKHSLDLITDEIMEDEKSEEFQDEKVDFPVSLEAYMQGVP